MVYNGSREHCDFVPPTRPTLTINFPALPQEVAVPQFNQRFYRSHVAGACFVAAALLLVSAAHVRGETNWPAWGGPDGTSHTSETGLPLHWSAENVLWKAALPGTGQSTPVVWGNQVFLTTALEGG